MKSCNARNKIKARFLVMDISDIWTTVGTRLPGQEKFHCIFIYYYPNLPVGCHSLVEPDSFYTGWLLIINGIFNTYNL